jgi:hypothetical protein
MMEGQDLFAFSSLSPTSWPLFKRHSEGSLVFNPEVTTKGDVCGVQEPEPEKFGG